MTDISLNEITEEIEKLSSFIETAQRLIYQSKTVEISALETRITDLCSALEKLPPNQSRDLVPKVESLLNSVDQLENDLNLQHDALMERLQLDQTHANPLMAQEVTDDDDKD